MVHVRMEPGLRAEKAGDVKPLLARALRQDRGPDDLDLPEEVRTAGVDLFGSRITVVGLTALQEAVDRGAGIGGLASPGPARSADPVPACSPAGVCATPRTRRESQRMDGRKLVRLGFDGVPAHSS
jgi:hypothetical protein